MEGDATPGDQSQSAGVRQAGAAEREDREAEFGRREQVGDDIGASVQVNSDHAWDQSGSDDKHRPGGQGYQAVEKQEYSKSATAGLQSREPDEPDTGL